MFEYASTILGHFNNTVSSVKIYSINSFRIDVEDFVYILETAIGAFILYETDYMFDTDASIDVLKAIATEHNFSYVELLTPDQFGKDPRILRSEGSSRIYLAAKMNANEPSIRSDPLSYGGSTSQ